MKQVRLSRRSFLRGAAAAVAAPSIIKARAQDFVVQGNLNVVVQHGPHWSSAPASLQQAMTDFVNWLQSNIFVQTTICINVDYGFCNGQTLPNGTIGFTQATGLQQLIAGGYSQVRAGIAANARSALAQQVLAASFPSSDPTGGASMVVNNAHMRILGIWAAWPAHAPGGTGADSYHGFGNTVNWFDGTPVANEYDAYGTVAHETTEGIFRQTTNFNSGGFCCPQNLVTYASPGVVRTGLFSSTASYFSTDGGVTNLRNYSQVGDQMDWRSNMGDPVDSFNAVAVSGQTEPVSTPDTQLFDVMGCSSIPA